MPKDPFSLIPDLGASATSMLAACEALAQRLREAERQRDEAEMVLRRIVYRRRKGLELIQDSEVTAINGIAVRNANPMRSSASDDAIDTAETVLHEAVRQAVGLLNQAELTTNAHRQAHQVLRRSLLWVAEHSDDTARRHSCAPD